ncbi:MAG: hypothetical protein J7L12_00665 [Desulfurococcales archaeon]|nr:hypothetical protein [Desulfurococcales archaeon]
MDDAILYKNIESLTLKRDKLLRKLRRQVRDYGRGRIQYSDLQVTLMELRKTRRAYVRVIGSPIKMSGELRDSLATLIEFTFLVSINDEQEILRRLIALMRKNGIEENLIRNIEEDLKEVNEFGKLISEVLTSLQQQSL